MKTILKLNDTYPYIYFSLVCLLIFSQHLNSNGTIWSELLMLCITSVFIIQLLHKLKHLDLLLGIVTFFWSLWMLGAVYSDAIKIDSWTWTSYEIFMVIFPITNFICSIKLLAKNFKSGENVNEFF